MTRGAPTTGPWRPITVRPGQWADYRLFHAQGGTDRVWQWWCPNHVDLIVTGYGRTHRRAMVNAERHVRRHHPASAVPPPTSITVTVTITR